MNVVSLFAGIGGFDLGFERAGMATVAQVELDPYATTILERHWPDVRRYTDIRETDLDDLSNRIDVLTGGFPCQDYSLAGRGAGLAGDRGALWWEFHRLIARHRPTWIIGENVPGLLSNDDGRSFETIIGSMVELGYGLVWRILDSRYFGVPQRRRRIFIVGHSGGTPRPEILALGDGCYGDLGPIETERRSPAGAPPGARDRRRYTAFTENQRAEIRDLGDTATALAATYSAKQQTYVTAWSIYPLAGQGSELAATELTDTAGPLTATDGKLHERGTRIATLDNVRRLTPTECERLQGFPDGWTEGNSDAQRYKQLGNAVTVPVAEWLAHRILTEGDPE